MRKRKAATAFESVVRFLRAHDRTAEELRARLRAKGYEGPDVEAAIARARELGYLDEARTAKAIVERWRDRGASRALIEAKLGAAGVGEAIGRRALEALPSDRELAKRAIRMRFRDAPASAARVARYLAGRGFDDQEIEQLLG